MRYILAILAVVLSSCGVTPNSIDYSPSRSVTSSEVLDIAESYLTHTWRPTGANVFHGVDADGVVQAMDFLVLQQQAH